MSAATEPGEGFAVLRGVIDASGGEWADPMPVSEREAAPWESSMEAVCESLALRGALENLERRNAEDTLGEGPYSGSPVHARPALATAHELIERGVISEAELAAKMDEVRARFEAD
jgi:hypothetical protein